MRSIMYRYTCGVHDMWLMRFVGPKPVTHESYSWAPHPMLSYCLAWLSVALIYTKYFPTYQSKEPVVNCWSKFKSHVQAPRTIRGLSVIMVDWLGPQGTCADGTPSMIMGPRLLFIGVVQVKVNCISIILFRLYMHSTK